MYNIEVCYKFIFGAMFEEMVLNDIAEKVHEYTNADVVFVSCFGEILACSCRRDEKRYLTFGDYEELFGENPADGSRKLVFPVYRGELVTGYVVLRDIDTEQTVFFQELGKLLAQASQRFFEEKERDTFFHLALKNQVICRTIFSGEPYHKTMADILEGNYIIVIFPKNKVVQESDLIKTRGPWKHLYVYEEESFITIILYRVNEENAHEIYSKTDSMKIECCISEMFEDLSVCRAKQDFLKQIMSMKKRQDNVGMKREKDWYMEGLFSYTGTLIKDAGLSDYSILRLIEEDKKNNTEFYHTLKMYLLCENNVTMAAEKLYIHRNTMVYRLKQIRSCIEVDFNDGNISRELLAFMMMYDASEGQGNR